MANTKPNWNNMVDITVPTGTNGWLYSGEVIINGIKVRFPVGTPTSVPEPAAVLLEKMIELEREEAGNGAMPDNHYIGSVTIPAGETLTLEEGAKVNDKAGVLATAGGETVILPETVLTVASDAVQAPITTPLQAPVADGDAVSINYNGTAYECTGVAVEGMGVGFGNLTEVGLEGSNPDAPFAVVLVPEGVEQDDDGVISYLYGIVMPMDGSTTVTLSIVQVGAASGGDAGGGIFEVNVSATGYDSGTGHDFSAFDKTFAEIVNAHEAGKYIRINVNYPSGMTAYGYVSAYGTQSGMTGFVVGIPRTTSPLAIAQYVLFANGNGEISATEKK